MATATATITQLEQRRQTATIRELRVAQRQQELRPLYDELKRRGIAPFRIAPYVGLDSNPNRIYAIFSGRLPAPPDFIDNICEWTGIPLSKVLPPNVYRERSAMLSYEMTIEDIEGRDWKGY